MMGCGLLGMCYVKYGKNKMSVCLINIEDLMVNVHMYGVTHDRVWPAGVCAGKSGKIRACLINVRDFFHHFLVKLILFSFYTQ